MNKDAITSRLRRFEHLIVTVLICMMMFVVVMSTARFGYRIFEELMAPPLLMLDVDQLFKVFGMFLMILLGLELLESLRAYIEEEQVHVEVIVTVALIAVGRKVVTMDLYKLSELKLIGVALQVISLAASYFNLLKFITWTLPTNLGKAWCCWWPWWPGCSSGCSRCPTNGPGFPGSAGGGAPRG